MLARMVMKQGIKEIYDQIKRWSNYFICCIWQIWAAAWITKQMTDSWKIFYDGFGEYEQDRFVNMMFPF